MRIIENFKICIYRLIAGGMFRQLTFLFLFFILVFISLTFMLDMDSSRLFHNMTSFDYPPKDNHLLLQLLYLTGVVFFSGFLVMVLTNSVRNKIELFKSGDVRLRLNNKISILGYNEITIGLIRKEIGNRNIEIIVENSVSKVREEVEGLFGSRNDIYVFHGGRSSQKDLASFHLNEAHDIYIVGENEDNSDFKNLECYSKLCKLHNFGGWNSNIYLFLKEQSSFTLFSNRSYNKGYETIDLNHRLTVLNSDENWARRILVDIDNQWPERSLYMRDRSPNVDSDSRVHILLFGMTTTGEIIAKTAALSCHFPNYVTKGVRTKITVIDDNFINNRGIFGGRYSDFLKMCRYSIRNIRNGKSNLIYTHEPDEGLDLLDIEWEFIESVPDDILLQNELSKLCYNKKDILTAIICNNNDSENINIALGLPRDFFDNNIPVWVYVKSDYSLSTYLRGSRYSNVVPWGMLDSFLMDNSWLDSTAKLINYFYCTMDFNTFRNNKYINATKEEIDIEWNHLPLEYRITTINDTVGIPSMLRCMIELLSSNSNSIFDSDIFERVEHVRWLTSILLRGFRPLTPEMKQDLIESGERGKRTELKRQFYHPDIDYYDNLPNMAEINHSTIEFYRYLAENWNNKK